MYHTFFRLSPANMQMQTINVHKNTSSKFSFPPLPAHIVSPEEPVDVRVSVCVCLYNTICSTFVTILIKSVCKIVLLNCLVCKYGAE